MKFWKLSDYLEKLERIDSRNAITEQLAELFEESSDDEVAEVVYMVLGRLAPLYQRVEFNVADKMVMRAVEQAYDLPAKEVRMSYKELGDLGLVADKLKSQHSKLKTTNQNSSLLVREVFEQLTGIANEGGQGSQEKKVGGLSALLRNMSGLEAKYVVRIVLGRLRLGFSDKTVLDAISVMATGSKAGKERLELAYQMFPDVGKLALLVKKEGIYHIEDKVQVTLGVPVIPALCQRLKTAEEMIEKMGEVVVEPKYDGTRVQIHFSRKNEFGESVGVRNQESGSFRTFTRNLDETTHMFPELEVGVGQIQAESVILDTEAVGVHPQTGELLPFQETITRKRKHGIEEASRQVPLKFFVFDLLYLNGKSLLGLPLSERKKKLVEVIGKGKELELSVGIVTKDASELRKYHGQQLKEGLEGVVVKQVGSEYVPGRRGWQWVKFKEAETSQAKLADTIDVVVMGFYRGKGKRTKFGIGAFLVGMRKGEEVVTLAKIGTGLTDEQWYELKQKLEMEVNLDMPVNYVVHKQLIPDVWVDPVVVVEVAADEITKSPTHSAGYALRFPRLVRFRDDKSLNEITTLEELSALRN
jgi:DNA ligase-1